MVPKGVGAGHPGDRAVGQAARDLQHPGTQRRHYHRAAHHVGIRYLQLGRDPELPSLKVHPALPQQGAQDGEIFLDVPGRMGVGKAQPVLNGGAVGNADAQGEASPDGHLGGQGLLRQRDRMARVGGDDGGAQLDAVGLHAGHGDDGEHSGPEVLGQPVAVEAVSLASEMRCSRSATSRIIARAPTNNPILMAADSLWPDRYPNGTGHASGAGNSQSNRRGRPGARPPGYAAASADATTASCNSSTLQAGHNPRTWANVADRRSPNSASILEVATT